ncbi:CidA/LrgA family protein [Tibeticola sp.]|uniref:CidA/LrgA family protein n=1 Tax=Tibeticola sp. TaxID=2005368 RepID=UPI0026000B46|nr:CidA/LrgA family protein [Tibeticola sp.]
MRALEGLALLLLFQSAGELLSRALHLPFPGPVVGLLLLLPALRWRAVQHRVGAVAEFLLAHLSLLFVPVGVGVMTHLELLQQHGLRLLAVLLVSTWVALAVTAAVLRALLRDDAGGGEGADAQADPVSKEAR